MLRVTCWCSCVFCRGTLSSPWVVLEFGFGAPVIAMALLLLSWLTPSFPSLYVECLTVLYLDRPVAFVLFPSPVFL